MWYKVISILSLVLSLTSAYVIERSNDESPYLYVASGYKDACVDGMDKIRNAFGDESLQWDKELASRAEDWALTQAIHSPYQNSKHSKTVNGENLFMTTFISTADLADGLKCYHPLWAWYETRSDPDSWMKGLIIQMVGEKVHKFGIGTAINTKTKMAYFVGLFDFNMPISEDVWKYLKQKERWVIPNKDRLKSDKGKLNISCRNVNKEVIACSKRDNTRRVHYEEVSADKPLVL